MSLLSVVPDIDCGLAVLYASEAHYLVDRTFSFMTVELALRPDEQCGRFTLILEGEVPNDLERKRIEAGPRFMELKRISRCVLAPNAQGVWDFRKTFFDSNLITNQGYESPEPNDVVSVIRDDATVRFMGQAASVPEATAGVERIEHLTLVSAQCSGPPFSANAIQLFRLGLFITRRPRAVEGSDWRSWFTNQLQLSSRETFVTQFFTFSDEDERALDGRAAGRRFRQTRLAITAAPFADAGGWPDTWRNQATSDVWVLGWSHDRIALLHPRDLANPPVANETRYGLYTHPKKDKQHHPKDEKHRAPSPFRDIHVYPARHVPVLAGEQWVQPRKEPLPETEQIEFDVDAAGVTLGRILDVLDRRSGLVALLFAVLVGLGVDIRISLAVVAAYVVYRVSELLRRR